MTKKVQVPKKKKPLAVVKVKVPAGAKHVHIQVLSDDAISDATSR